MSQPSSVVIMHHSLGCPWFLAAQVLFQLLVARLDQSCLELCESLGMTPTSQASVLSLIDDWLASKLERESSTAQDLADCMKVFASHGSTLSTAIAYAEHLFAQKGTIRLMTGHKAKGLEFPTVYFLDPWLCRDDEQDQNLKYVIDTRSLNSLYYINSNQIRWS